VVRGDLIVIPADKLLITIQSQQAEYGSQTAANLGTAGAGTVSAQYCFDLADCNGPNLFNLTMTQLTSTRWQAADNTGSFVVFDTSLVSPSYSTSGHLNVGNYTYSTSEISPLSLFTNGQANFTGRETNGGVLEVVAKELTFTAVDEVRTVDGTLQTQTLRMQGLLAGDEVTVEGLASGTAVGEYRSLLRFQANPGADRANYRVIFVNGAMRIMSKQSAHSNRPNRANGSIEPRPVIIPSSSDSDQGSVQMAGGANPFQLAGTNLPETQEALCNLQDLSNCRCDSLQPAEASRVNVDMDSAQVCYQPAEGLAGTSSQSTANAKR